LFAGGEPLGEGIVAASKHQHRLADGRGLGALHQQIENVAILQNHVMDKRAVPKLDQLPGQRWPIEDALEVCTFPCGEVVGRDGDAQVNVAIGVTRASGETSPQPDRHNLLVLPEPGRERADCLRLGK